MAMIEKIRYRFLLRRLQEQPGATIKQGKHFLEYLGS
jgi:hypothetical protein